MKYLFFLFLVTQVSLFSTVSGQSGTKAPVVKPKTYAVIVGISNYADDKLDTLHFAGSDARNFYSFLSNKFIRNVDSNNVRQFIDENANYADVSTAFVIWLEELKERILPGDEVYIFWSGHGMVAEKDQKLLCRNTKLTNINNGKVIFTMSLKDIKTRISYFAQSSNVKVYLIVDACRSSGLANDSTVIADLESSGGPGEIYLYASSNGGSSYETPLLTPGSGVFTYFLLLGLQGGADKSPADGKVTLGELGTFLHQVVNSYVGNVLSTDPDDPFDQEPDLSAAIAANPNLVVTTLPISVARVYRKKADSIIAKLHLLATQNNRTSQPVNGTGATRKGIIGNRWFNQSEVTEPEESIQKETKIPAGTDSVEYRLFITILDRINEKRLVEPEDNSAFTYYRQLQKQFSKSPLVAKSKVALFGAALDKVKNLTEDYLAGKLENTSKEVFDLGYKELLMALQLVPNDSLFQADMKPKLIFLQTRALAGSKNPTDWTSGLDILDSSIAQSWQSAYLYHTKGILNGNKGRYFTAKRDFDSTLLFAPDWTFALYNSAINNFKLQEYGQSLDTCFKIVKIDSGFSRVYSLIGLNFETIEDAEKKPNYRKAIFYNELALKKKPANVSAYFNLGHIYSKNQLYLRDTARRAENLRLSLNYYRIGAYKYKDDNCLTMLGENYFDVGQHYDSAKYFYELSLAINPFNVRTLEDYATLLDVEGQRDEGNALFLNALKKSSYDYTIYAKYCAFAFDAFSPQVADSLFDQLLRINHQDPSVFLAFSALYERRDSLLKARDILRKGMEFIPESPSLTHAMASLYFLHRNSVLFNSHGLVSAKLYLDSAYLLSPGSSVANQDLSDFYFLTENDSATLFRHKADSLNKYVNTTKNFYRQVLVLADSMFRDKNYRSALNYYQQARMMRRNKFDVTLGTAKCYYQLNILDSAADYTQQANNINHDRDDDIQLKDLFGLIAFDKKDYKAAGRLFQIADEDKDDPDRLAEGLATFKLHGIRQAKSILATNSPDLSDAFNGITAQAGNFYSDNFIKEMKKFRDKLGAF